ncbi:MAG: hypothetical protein HY332_14565 [Chloroflexi bacterium]|nr:hypothetical protein [Chloroflexota bacterium]
MPASALGQAPLSGKGSLIGGRISVAQDGARVFEHKLRSLLHEAIEFATLFSRQQALVVTAGQFVHPRLDLWGQAANNVRLLIRRNWA